MKAQAQRDSLRTPGERSLRRPPGPAQPAARGPPGALSKTGWKEKEDVVVGAGTAATASDQISDRFLPEGAGSREGKKGRGSRVWFLPPPCFLFANVPGHGGSLTLSSAKAGVVFLGPKIKKPWNEPPRDLV